MEKVAKSGKTINLTKPSKIIELALLYAASGLTVIMTLWIFFEVILRYVFHQSVSFTFEITTWMMAWSVILLVGTVEKAREHVSVGILPQRIPVKYKPILTMIFDLSSLLFAIFLFWEGVQYAAIVKQLGVFSTTATHAPMWIVRICVPIGATSLFLFSLEHLIADFQQWARKGAIR